VEAGLNENIKQLRDDEGRSLVTKYAPSIIKRADELTEALAYLIQEVGQIGTNGSGSIPAGIKKGLAKAFENFDEYQFAKYRGKGDVKLSDVIRLVRPKPRAITLKDKKYTKAQRSELYKNIRHELLRQDDTWEAILSEEGRSAETWNKVIGMGKKFPFMAMLRNLRNIMQVGADLDPVISRLKDEQQILNSRQHPYRFYSAYKMIEREGHLKSQNIMEALENAMEISCGNLPQLGGTTAVLVDNSGSMHSRLSGDSIIEYSDISSFMGAVSHYICDTSHVIAYGSTVVPVKISRNNTIINNMEVISGAYTGGATNTYLAVQYLIQNRIKVDRIINFTDMQGYGQSSFNQMIQEYRRTINPDVWVYSINLAGYGTCELNVQHPKNIELSGWSPQILNFISSNESDMISFVDAVKEIKP